MIDNYQQALTLMEKMKLELPFTVYPDQGLLRKAEQQGDVLSPNQPMEVKQVVYLEEGGLICAVEKSPEDTLYLSSVTHLRIPDDHPLVEEIREYQNKRKYHLAVAEGKIGRAKRLARKVKKKKGFGN
ncbi:MAG: hypothetical protein QNJ33_12750 [Crocosphaera sp.]|nr:hypothetical protein [Crocosphaera sp.]